MVVAVVAEVAVVVVVAAVGFHLQVRLIMLRVTDFFFSHILASSGTNVPPSDYLKYCSLNETNRFEFAQAGDKG